MRLLAKTFKGLEKILAEEIKAIGGKNIRILKRAVSFEGDQKTMYRANYELRTAVRVLKEMYTFEILDDQDLYNNFYAIDWSEYLSLNKTFSIDTAVYSSLFNHTQYPALKAKDAIVDQFREKIGQRPNVALRDPSLKINLHIDELSCTISFDSSNEPLFKRGYRLDAVEAPMNEVLAAALIKLSGWNFDCDFYDPMCGSGTIAIEAALQAFNIPSQYSRETFGFMRWKDFDEKLWNTVKKEANEKRKLFHHEIFASDIDFKATRMAQINADEAELGDVINFKKKSIQKLKQESGKGFMIMNPPYDLRLKIKDINAFYKEIGDIMKNDFKNFTAWIISSNIEAMKNVGLKPTTKMQLWNGALECKFHSFDLY